MVGKKSSSLNQMSDLPGIFRQQKGKGPLRLLRVGEEIRRVLSEILERGDLRNQEISRYIPTVTEVIVSPDLRHADIFVMPLILDEKNIPRVLDLLKEEASFLRQSLAKKVALKRIPELHFKYDTRFTKMDEIDRLLYSDKVQEDLKK